MESDKELIITRKHNEEPLKISLKGSLSIFTVNSFKNDIFSYKIDDDIIIDATELEYIDSSGYGILIKLSRDLKIKNKNVIIENASHRIKEGFHMMSLESLFRII